MGLFRRKERIQTNMYLHLALLKTYSGFEQKVYDVLFDTPEIIECYPLLGDWDYFIKIASTDSLDLDIEKKIKSIEGVANIMLLTRPSIDRLPKGFKKRDVGFEKHFDIL